MKSTIAKKTEGYGYKYTELADINKYCEDNKIRYYQEIETCDINQKDYIVTFLTYDDGQTWERHRGCQIVDAVLQGIKNPVQEYGSSITYCRRYSLLMALGLATEDDDGATFTIKREPTKDYVISFGKYSGETMENVLKKDEQYVQWFINNKADDYAKSCYELISGEKLPTDSEQDERIKIISEINELERQTDTDHEEIIDYFKVKSMSAMTNAQLNECKIILEKKLNKKESE